MGHKGTLKCQLGVENKYELNMRIKDDNNNLPL